ncbi:hypothetical protein [Caldalkalibacillus mannanilyticus]|uniref:hypothetical protein n=1 Tax=Caldalkalibacillus mannanilyticus TaxID=1418 RepID=UPI000468DCA1|nr:hypothetical protein [Caldalkalibacillus mannanilyticus]
MRKKLYIGEGTGLGELQAAWLECYRTQLDQETERSFQNQEKGLFIKIGENEQKQEVYWIAVGRSKEICLQAWADVWPLVDDSILNWEIVHPLHEGLE